MTAGRPVRLLHVHSSFDAGGKELRAARLIDAFGPAIEHTIVSATPGALGAAAAISRRMTVRYPRDFPPLTGFPGFGRLRKVAAAMAGYDLILTYNWGAMDAVMAHTLYSDLHTLSPLVHHEDGFNEDEATRLKLRRNWYRRIALGRAIALVVPSRRLETIALKTWMQPPTRIHRIPNGIPTAAFAKKPRAGVLPGLVKRKGEFWLGSLGGLRQVKRYDRLVRAIATLPDEWQLVILGEGPERAALTALAVELGVEHRVHLPGFVARPEQAVGLFDVFALSSDSEQFPISAVEAMAAGLPVAAPDVGDIADMVAAENRPFVTPAGDEAALAQALRTLAADPGARAAIGAINREKARKAYDETHMIERYRRLYAGAMGRDDLT
jgi:glycosyltransferase involved in cell wall biosynthesis